MHHIKENYLKCSFQSGDGQLQGSRQRNSPNSCEGWGARGIERSRAFHRRASTQRRQSLVVRLLAVELEEEEGQKPWQAGANWEVHAQRYPL